MRLQWTSLLWFFGFVISPPTAPGQSALSQNSGINSADTWVTVDMTFSGSASATFSSPIYLASVGNSSNTVAAPPPTQTMHVEAGYDSSGGLVMNVWPSGAAVNGLTTDASAIGFIRFAAGQVTVFDQTGNALPLSLPSGSMSPSWPLSLLGANPGPSVIGGLVVPNIQRHASALSAALTLSSGSGPSTASLQVPASSGVTAAWTYLQSGSNWIAQEVTLTPALSSATASRTIQFANLNWSDNSTNDAARAAAGATGQAPPSAVTTQPGTISTPQADPAPTASATTIDPADCSSHTYSFGGPQNVAFMHGIFSKSCAWTRMANWLNQDFRFAAEAIPTLGTTSGITGQGLQLVGEINSVGGGNYILVGHSQGGLASRYAAQYFQSISQTQSSPVEGVVTVDTPHEGANAAQALQTVTTVGFDALGWWLWDDLGCGTSFDNFGCYFAAMLFATAAIDSDLIWSSFAQSIVDLSPGSPFLTNLNDNALNNGAAENFSQAAVIGYTPQRWAVVRWLDNWLAGNLWCPGPNNYCCNPEDACGERALAADTEYFYDVLEVTLAILVFEEMTWCEFTGGEDCVIPPWIESAINFVVNAMAVMDIGDALWDIAVDLPGDGTSDALVQGPSQYYPASTAQQYLIAPSDSHSGALKSSYDHAVLYNILAKPPFRVPTQASCAFSVSNSPDSVSGNASTGSLSLTTGSGCSWSAVSQSPWISITSGVNGTSGGLVDFSVAANPVTIPRSGAVQVGNGTSQALFTVNQGGACYYSLSEGPEVAAPAAGTSSTVQVTAPIDCPWSAVSNSSWLTITAGATGTGSGSFTWTAAANTGTSDRSGTITVMNQTLTVVDGIAVGTPGHGTVTISGLPRIAVMRPCGTYPACDVFEAGSVSIIVAGLTFEAGFSGSSTTAASLASELAGEMNYPLSPVSATVSGAAISITSAVNGAATNYALVTSATFSPDCPNGVLCFYSPAFTAAASGQNLTGGTN